MSILLLCMVMHASNYAFSATHTRMHISAPTLGTEHERPLCHPPLDLRLKVHWDVRLSQHCWIHALLYMFWLLAQAYIHSTWISVIHDELARLTVLTGIYLLCVLKLFYTDVHIKSTWRERYFFPASKFVVIFVLNSLTYLPMIAIVLFQWCAVPGSNTLVFLCPYRHN